jgi:ribonuclease HI
VISPKPQVACWVDGCARPNPGRGSYGILLRHGDHEKRLSGRIPEYPCSNQRSEIHAAVKALSSLKQPCAVRVISDSQLLIKTMAGEYHRRSNLDLWQALDAAALPHQVEWAGVRGHSGDPGNEEARQLALEAARAEEKPAQIFGQVPEEKAARSEPLPDLPICEPRRYDDDPDLHYCGRTVIYKDPHKRREDGCPGALVVCVECYDTFLEFWRQAQDARAKRKEWEL